jgi:hypothetical protein
LRIKYDPPIIAGEHWDVLVAWKQARLSRLLRIAHTEGIVVTSPTTARVAPTTFRLDGGSADGGAEYRAGQTSIIELSQAQLNALQADIAAVSAEFDYQTVCN